VILLDTNVVSEMMRQQVHPAVDAFIETKRADELFVPSIVVAEILYGVGRLPMGQRRKQIEAKFDAFIQRGFASRILPFDAACAAGYATARTARAQMGRPVEVQDALIGGLALAHGATLATRNISDFDGYGLSLVDPWKAE
jgi:predicted nucleic acid-binding protein